MRRAASDRAVAGVKRFFCGERRGGAGRELRDAESGADGGGSLCGPQRSALRWALPRAPEVRGFFFTPLFNGCFMLNLEPSLFSVLLFFLFYILIFHNVPQKV